MTHPVAVQGLHVDEPAVDEITAPLLAAIQHSFEEAMASLDDLARSSGPVATAGTRRIRARRRSTCAWSSCRPYRRRRRNPPRR